MPVAALVAAIAIVIAGGVALGYYGAQQFTWQVDKWIDDTKKDAAKSVAVIVGGAVLLWILWRQV